MSNIRIAVYDDEKHAYVDSVTKALAPSVTQCLAAVGLVSYDGVRKEVLERKSAIGIEAHRACSFLAKGLEIEDIDPRVSPYLDGYREFAEKKKWKPFVIQPEPRISDINAMPVGFQPDEVGALDGQETVLELKTTADVGTHMGVQLAGYDLCMDAPRRKRVVLQLFPDGKFKLFEDTEKNSKVFDGQSDYMMFNCAVFTVYFKHNRGIQRIEELVNG